MTDDRTDDEAQGRPFDLEPARDPAPEPRVDPQAAARAERQLGLESRQVLDEATAAPNASPAPPRAGLRRTGTRPEGRPGPSPVARHPERGLSRFFRWMITPTFYYVVGLLISAGVLLGLYNPSSGQALAMWPHEVLQQKPWTFGVDQVRVVALAVALLGGVLALLLRRRRARPILAAVAFAFPLLALHGSGLEGGVKPVLPIVIGLLGGLLLDVAPGRRRRGALFVGLILLGGLLFMPWGPEHGVAEPATYRSLASDALDRFESLPTEEGNWLDRIAGPLTEGIALLVLSIAALAWAGLGGRWVRWAAGGAMLLLVTWLMLSALHGDGWEAGTKAFSVLFFGSALAYMLPLAGAVAELARPRA